MDPRETPKCPEPNLREFLDILGVEYSDFLANRPANVEAPQIEEEWQTRLQEASTCRQCSLCESRQQVVYGNGALNAELMFVGEAPGTYEEKAGQAFSGESGALLDRMLAAMNLGRDQVFLTYLVKCRPPQGRNAEESEIQTCASYLDFQIKFIRPKIIVALGALATKQLLSSQESFENLRGQFLTVQKESWGGGVQVLPTFHPAYLLAHSDMKKLAWQDLQLVMRELGL